MSTPNEPANSTPAAPVAEAKRTLRREMRTLRRSLPNRAERSAAIIEHLVATDAVRQASRLMAYDSIPGEVETSSLLAWCRDRGIDTAMPEDDGLDPAWPDVIVVPGTAFTARGERLGQGGGWYDQFLPKRRADAFIVAIAFREQLVEKLPTEPHDIIMHCVVTDDGPLFGDDR